MIQRTSLLIVEIAAATLTGMVLVVAVLVWLLSSGPVSLAVLTPYLESALTPEDGSLRVEIAETSLVWGGWQRAVDVRVANVRVTGGEDRPLLTLPEASVGVSLRALLRGRVEPTSIDVVGAHATVERAEDGSVAYGLGVGEGGGASTGEVAAGLARQLVLPPSRNRALGQLQRVRILDAGVTYVDRVNGVEWRSTAADVVLTRNPGGLVAHAAGVLETQGYQTAIEASLVFDSTGDVAQATLDFDGLHPEALAASLPDLAWLGRFDLPLSGELRAELSQSRGLEAVHFDIRGGGWVDLPQHLPREIRVVRLELEGTVEGDLRRISLDRGYADFGGPVVQIQASGLQVGREMRIRVDADVHDMPMADLENYWPLGLGDNARDWTTANIRDGIVDAGRVSLVLGVPLDDPAAAEAVSLSGTLDYTGLSVRYMPTLPKVTDIDGTATFGQDYFDLLVHTGRLNDIAVEQASIHMFDLDRPAERISIDVVMRGPLRTALEVLDHEPLHFVRAHGIDTDGVWGDAAIRMAMAFPLEMDLRVEDIATTAVASLRGVVLEPGPFDLTVRDGALELRLDDERMHVEGTLALNDVPVALDWVEMHGAGATFRSRYRVRGQVDDAGRQRFGMPDLPFVSGSTGVEIDYQTGLDGTGRVSAAIDLAETVLSVPQLALLKPLGRPGRATLDMTLGPDGHPGIQRFAVEAGALEASGSVAFDAGDLAAWRMQVDRFVHGRDDLYGTVAAMPGGGLDIAVHGRRFDIAPLIEGDGTEGREQAAEEPSRPLRLRATVETLDWGPNRQFRNVAAQAERDGLHWQRLSVAGESETGSKLRLDYGPVDDGYAFLFEADDAGSTLQALDWSDEVRGGTIRIDGRRRAADGPLEGGFRLARFKLTEVPALVRLLQVASVAGALTAIGQEGMDFEVFEGAYVHRDGRVTVDRSRAYGSTIGITMEGTVDTNAEIVDLRGTFIPAYIVSRVLGAIPLLGTLITGGEDQGLFAASYRVTGRLDDPDVSVNPLSALAPGFLRRVFGVIGDAGQVSDIPPATATQ